ncbi:IPT/TIG domain-containing protein, partial [Rhodopseudomonas palustris]|uniref:IPT/TIG domain-containing protein n=3 Tax=Rhodopseudomonas TaxID=1073 RepID=UPI000AC39BFC
PAPTVTSITPASGGTLGGTVVTIIGKSFTGATAVTFGADAATGIVVVNATTITATSPPHATGTVDVTVTTPAGIGIGTGLFSYLRPAPSVTGIDPGSGPTTGGTRVTISGSEFIGVTAVKFGASNATAFTVGNDTQITAISAAGALGSVHVTVTTASGTSASSAANQFTYVVPADSVKLQALQTAVTPIVAQFSGQAITGAVASAISEGFGGNGALITPSGSGVRINFAADPDTDARPAAAQRGSDPFSTANGSYDDGSRGRARLRSRTGDAFDAFAAVGGPANAPPRRRSEPRDWLGWAEVSGATLGHGSSSAASSDATIYGSQINLTAGLTRILTPHVLVGVLGGWETFDYRSDALQGRMTGDGWTVGSYLGWKLTPGLRFDAAVAYSAIGYDGSAGTASGSFQGTRWLISGGLTGSHHLQGLEIEPSARIYALWEHENTYTDTLGTAQPQRDFSTGRGSGGLKLSYPLAWTSTTLLVPYLGLYGDYYFNADDATAIPTRFDGWSARATGGVAARFGNGAQLAAGLERGGIGGNFALWTYRVRASVPFAAQ